MGRRTSGVIILSLAALALGACGGTKTTEGGQKVVTITVEAGGSTTDEFSDAPEAGEEETVDTTTTAEPSGDQYTLGQTAEDDGIAFKVTALKEVDEIAVGPYSYPNRPIRPAKGAKLVEATVVWKNNTKKSTSNFCGQGGAGLLDQEDRNFDPMSRQFDIKGNNLCDDVQPGFKDTAYLAFQMPKDSEIAGLALWNSLSEDDFLNETYVVFVP